MPRGQTFLRRRPKVKMGVRQSTVIRCQSHLAWVRGCECALTGKHTLKGVVHQCSGGIEAAHVRRGTDGGTGMKPGDNWTLPLCQDAHARQHEMGENWFEMCWGIDMKAVAAQLWQRSPHRRKYEFKQETK